MLLGLGIDALGLCGLFFIHSFINNTISAFPLKWKNNGDTYSWIEFPWFVTILKLEKQPAIPLW
jgi:hypothetical protein